MNIFLIVILAAGFYSAAQLRRETFPELARSTEPQS
jgi:hypothetical protein